MVQYPTQIYPDKISRCKIGKWYFWYNWKKCDFVSFGNVSIRYNIYNDCVLKRILFYFTVTFIINTPLTKSIKNIGFQSLLIFYQCIQTLWLVIIFKYYFLPMIYQSLHMHCSYCKCLAKVLLLQNKVFIYILPICTNHDW